MWSVYVEAIQQRGSTCIVIVQQQQLRCCLCKNWIDTDRDQKRSTDIEKKKDEVQERVELGSI